MNRKTKADLQAEVKALRLELNKTEACLVEAENELKVARRRADSFKQFVHDQRTEIYSWQQAHKQLAETMMQHSDNMPTP